MYALCQLTRADPTNSAKGYTVEIARKCRYQALQYNTISAYIVLQEGQNPYEITPPRKIRTMPISRKLQLTRQKTFHRYVPLVHAVMWIYVFTDRRLLLSSHHTVLSTQRHQYTQCPHDCFASPEGGTLLCIFLEPARTSKMVLIVQCGSCLLYTSPSPRDGLLSRMPSSA